MARILTLLAATTVVLVVAGPALAADDSRVKAATRQTEEGARKLADGEVGEGLKETAKGVGNTVLEGARYTGDKVKESARAAEPEARTAWHKFRDGAVAFAGSVRNFFAKLVE